MKRGLSVLALVALGCSSAPKWGDEPQGSGNNNNDMMNPSQDDGSAMMNPQDDGGPMVDSGMMDSSMVDASDGFDQFQHHNLDVINMYRATLNIAPLKLDMQLSTFALAGSQQLSQDHIPHNHFITAANNNTLWSSGFNTQAGENQGDPSGWPKLSSNATQNEMMQIDQIQQAMFNEGPGAGEAHGHYMNMMNSKFKRLGVGLLEVNSKLYLTNDFSD